MTRLQADVIVQAPVLQSHSLASFHPFGTRSCPYTSRLKSSLLLSAFCALFRHQVTLQVALACDHPEMKNHSNTVTMLCALLFDADHHDAVRPFVLQHIVRHRD
jgi:hypothetical protein